MGYFSNGTEGEAYEDKWCSRCIHGKWYREADGKPCPVWDMHLMENYDQFPEQEMLEPAISKASLRRTFLSALIPLTEDGLGNQECKLFNEVIAPDAMSPAYMGALEQIDDLLGQLGEIDEMLGFALGIPVARWERLDKLRKLTERADG